jgi:hypothetical protein
MYRLRYALLRLRSWYYRLPCYFNRHAWSTWDLDHNRRWFRVCCSCLEREVGGFLDPQHELDQADEDGDD